MMGVIVYSTESRPAPLPEIPRYVVCPTCHYEREVGVGCGLPCV